MSKLIDIWQSLPRIAQWLITGTALAYVRQKFPGVIPEDITPVEILGGSFVAGVAHHVEDRHEDAQNNPGSATVNINVPPKA